MEKSVVTHISVATVLVVLLAAAPAALAADYTVGGSSGWASGVNYDSWVEGKTFKVGDSLVFRYGPSHSVDVVDKDGYDNCDSSKASNSFSSGNNQIDLKTAGPMYFICPTPGHCESGMKLSINVQDSSTTPSTPSSPSPPSTTTPSPPGSSATPAAGTPAAGTPVSPGGGTSSTPSPPNAASRGFMSYSMLACSLLFGYAILHMG